MNKLVPGALFSIRDSQEYKLREQIQNGLRGTMPHGDMKNYAKAWDRAVQGFREYDPDGSKLAALLRK